MLYVQGLNATGDATLSIESKGSYDHVENGSRGFRSHIIPLKATIVLGVALEDVLHGFGNSICLKHSSRNRLLDQSRERTQREAERDQVTQYIIEHLAHISRLHDAVLLEISGPKKDCECCAARVGILSTRQIGLPSSGSGASSTRTSRAPSARNCTHSQSKRQFARISRLHLSKLLLQWLMDPNVC